MLEKAQNLEGYSERIRELEHKGDNITHEILTKLSTTFITPMDREDIHALSSRLDDVLDLIEAVSNKTILYRLTEFSPEMLELSSIIVRCAAQMQSAVGSLDKHDRIMDHLIEINRLENEGDRVSRSAIATLFDNERDPIALIKKKELTEVLEEAIDRCEDVANVIETVVLKSA
jgi:predicted phosphate transport protein (TIGR00153 family)